MTNHKMDTSPTKKPEIKKITGISLIWLIPVLTLLIGGWLIVKTINEKGPEITITFITAEGVESGKTRIKYKNVEIGVVKSVEFNDDFSRVQLTADMTNEAEYFLKKNARFWIVKPRLSLKGVTGLGTLVSGSYIEIEPGNGEAQRDFIGLEIPPVIKVGNPGKKVILQTNDLGSLSTGSPIYYQGISVGKVLGYKLSDDKKSILVYLFVNAPYHKLINQSTQFWNVSGIGLSLDGNGIAVQTPSIQSLLFGGVAFVTPVQSNDKNTVANDHVFTLHSNYRSALENRTSSITRFVLFFEDSIRGLKVGAPVEFKGIQIGKVSDLQLQFDADKSLFNIPVTIDIEEQRVLANKKTTQTSIKQLLNQLVKKGLRAQLNTSNLLTGQLFIDLSMRPDTKIALMNTSSKLPELPTIHSGLSEITSSLKVFLSKVNKIDFEKLNQELVGTLQGSNKLLNNPDLHKSITEMKKSFLVFQSLLKKLDKHAIPLTENFEKTMASGNQALENIQVTLSLLNNLLKSDSPMQYSLIEMADEMTDAARALNTLLELLERNPQSLIFGKPAGDE